MADASAIARDTAAIVEWQRAREGAGKTRLFNAIFRSKAGLIRQLTQKAARAEKTAEDLEDLFQAGAIGFQKALERFEPERGFSISTYAAWWIRHEVQRVARRANPIALPRIRLTNAERERVILALRADPDVTPEAIGVRRSQFEQVKASFGLRYVSDDTPRGAVAVERRLLGEAGLFDGEEMLDEARRHRALRGILFRVRAGMSAERIGLSPDAYELALEVIRLDDLEKKTMSEMDPQQQQHVNGADLLAKPKRRYTKRKTATTPRKPVVRAVAAPPAAKTSIRDVLVQKLMARITRLADAALVDLFAQIPDAA